VPDLTPIPAPASTGQEPPLPLMSFLLTAASDSLTCAGRVRQRGHRHSHVWIAGRDCAGPASAPEMASQILHGKSVTVRG
jgi:hypothetical protein